MDSWSHGGRRHSSKNESNEGEENATISMSSSYSHGRGYKGRLHRSRSVSISRQDLFASPAGPQLSRSSKKGEAEQKDAAVGCQSPEMQSTSRPPPGIDKRERLWQ